MISQNDKTYIFFSAMELTVKRCHEIVEHYKSDKTLDAILNGDKFIVEYLGEDYDKFRQKLINFSFETLEKYLNNKHVGYFTIESEIYPEQLKQLDEPPYILYYIGDVSLISTKCLAIVGSRTPTYYGREVTENFARQLVKNGFTIVSGLSTGVDKIAHETALNEGGKTIAVLGNGFQNMYPKSNINLAREIAQKGLLLTEYYPTFQARNYSFPMRNRIIAGLSKGVLITEAAKKSGSLHTKNFALDLGIDVFSVPGNITSPKSEGSNNIIKYGHAQMVTTPNDILEQYGIKPQKVEKQKIELNFDENKIYNVLKDGEKSFDEIQCQTGILVQTLNTCLTTMQIRGIIKKLPGNYYAI